MSQFLSDQLGRVGKNRLAYANPNTIRPHKDIRRVHTLNPRSANKETGLGLIIDVHDQKGRLVDRVEGHSLVAQFLQVLMGFMGNQTLPASGIYVPQRKNGVSNIMEDANLTITNATNASPIVITTSGNHGFEESDVAQVFGVLGNTNANGRHTVSVLTTTTFSLVGTTGNGTFDGSLNPRCREWNITAPRPTSHNLWRPEPKLGRSNVAVDIDDIFLINEIGGEGAIPGHLFDGGVLISIPSLNTTAGTVECTLTRDFTNNSGATINVQEAALYAQHTNEAFMSPRFMIARDLVTLNIDVGATLGLSYRIRTTKGVTGGFTRWFMEMLYRQFAQTAREVTTVFGGSDSRSPGAGQLIAVAAGGRNKHASDLSGEEAQFFGPQLGLGTAAMTIDDTAMQTRITHGTGTDQMLIYGGFIQNYVQGASAASFDIVRLFHNDSGAPITVNETGVYAGFASGEDLLGPAMIARDVLAVGVEVADGEIIRSTHTIQLQE